MRSAVETMDAKAASLFMQDEDRKSPLFFPIAQTGLSDDYLHMEPSDARQSAQEVLEKGHLAVYDAGRDPRIQNHELKIAEGIASILAVPVMAGNRMTGVLSLYTADHRHFSEDEIDFLTALAEQGGMAVERARLLEQIRRNTELFLSLSEGINSSLDLKKIMEILTAGVARAFGVKAASVRLLDDEKRSLRLIASHGLSDEYLNKGPVSAEKSIAESLKGHVVAIDDVSIAEGVQYREEKKAEGIVSILSVPIRAMDEIIGVLHLYSGVPREFTPDEIKLATAIAHQGGLAIRNACVYLLLKEDLEDLKGDIWSHRSWF